MRAAAVKSSHSPSAELPHSAPFHRRPVPLPPPPLQPPPLLRRPQPPLPLQPPPLPPPQPHQQLLKVPYFTAFPALTLLTTAPCLTLRSDGICCFACNPCVFAAMDVNSLFGPHAFQPPDDETWSAQIPGQSRASSFLSLHLFSHASHFLSPPTELVPTSSPSGDLDSRRHHNRHPNCFSAEHRSHEECEFEGAHACLHPSSHQFYHWRANFPGASNEPHHIHCSDGIGDFIR